MLAPKQATASKVPKQPGPNAPPDIPDPEGPRLDSIAEQSNTTYHSQTMLLGIARLLSITLASLLPIVSIVVLYYVHRMPKRLGIISGFTATFSFVLGLVTNCHMVDVFAASAA
jgi:hypothetical protein